MVEAYIVGANKNTVTASAGELTLEAISNATIDTDSVAVSVSGVIGGSTAVALSGAGAEATNNIKNKIQAYHHWLHLR